MRHNDHIHLVLERGQTGLRERQMARAEDVTVIRKASLDAAGKRLKTLSSSQICD